MGVPFIKVFYTPPEGVEREITELVSVVDNRGLELNTARSTFTVNTSNKRHGTGDGESIFQEDGAVEIYCDYEPITRSQAQLLMNGKVTEVSPSVGSSSRQTTIQAADRAMLLLGNLWGQTFENQTTPQIIKSIIDSTSQEIDTNTGIATTTSSGGSFKNLERYSNVGKSVFDWIAELSQPEFTGDDKAYIFFVDKDQVFRWFYPSTTKDGNIVVGEDHVVSVDLRRNVDQVINFVIFNAGADLRGNGVQWYYFDTQQRSNEIKGRYFPFTNESSKVFDTEILTGNLVEDLDDGTIPYKGKFFSETSYPFTTSWGVEVNNFGEYNAAFRANLRNRGVTRAAEITRAFSKLRWNGTVDLRGTLDWNAGDLFEFTDTNLGLNKELLRIQDVQHTINNQGWVTKLQVEQDEEAISETIE
jgi:hypothetical protein